MSKATLALLKLALFLCAIAIFAGGGLSAFGQAGAKPAPLATPAPAEIHARGTLKSVDSSLPDDPSVDKMLEAYAPKVRALNLAG